MKLRTSLSIMLIGMISLTAFATTSKLEQKPKPTFTLDQKVYVEVVNVEAFDLVYIEVAIKSLSNANAYFTLKNVDEPCNTLAYPDDVGWNDSRFNYNQYSKSNLPSTNRIPIASLGNKTKAKIRSDC
ncbi:hypothetical protein [Flavobacterium sp.]|uniref:hypothetical protein n=1 Tax=Flavobacterium sp. TaxID=239 RepID=UPI00286D772D|nr:hypothetical protein [Flavobacterium sp.]